MPVGTQLLVHHVSGLPLGANKWFLYAMLEYVHFHA